jgi:hypothetical protein
MKHQNQHQNPHRRPTPQLLACALASCLAMAAPWAIAQNSTATIRGRVTADSTPAASAEVTATNVANGAVRRVSADANGNYNLVGLQPGTYRIDASANGRTSSQVVTVQIGQSTSLDLPVGGVAETGPTQAATTLAGIEVVGQRLVEMKTSEVATNITKRQIEDLPQNSRNFLNFASLAPGVSTPRDPNVKSFSAAGQPSNQTNVFIDGANLKNNILQGGLVGQDSSKGNPFSQEAIQEFRVLTQNYKAEYEQAGTATITAITKSGTNEFHGSVYGFLQTKGMVAQEEFSERRGEDKPDYRREQYGATFGGPIIKDRLHFFLSYEANHEDGNGSVNISDPAFAQYNGTFPKPFREDVWFGKLSWIASDNDNVDLSFTRRRDSEVIGFGGGTAYTARQNRDNSVDDALVRWQHYGNGWLNELSLDYGKYAFNPSAANPNLVSQNFFGAGLVGGASSLQDKQQKNLTLRDDLTFSDIEWHGNHVIKTGIKFARYNLDLLENNNANPAYNYDRNRPTGFNVPFEAFYSPTGKFANIDNGQVGLYIQDDWDVNPRLQLNLGLRWDYETNPYNKDYVTPQNSVDVINFLGLSSDYISTGSNRDSDTGMIQPRLGFSYDFSQGNDQSWVVFGGAGRYYDRIPLDNPIQEAFHSQYPYYHFFFSLDGSPVNGSPAVMWDPSYLTAEGLQRLITSGNVGSGELDLLNNKTKSPYSDQFSLGLRHVMGDWVGSVTLSRVLGHDQFTWIWGNRLANGNFISGPHNYDRILINSTKNYSSTGLFVSLDKPYTDESGWGAGLAYTYQDAKKQGGDAYSLDYVSPALYPDNHVGERHRLVVNGIVRLPWDMQLTGLGTFASSAPFDVFRNFDYNGGPQGPGPDRGIHLGGAYGGPFKQVDLSLTKNFRFGGDQVLQLRADAFNIFGWDNFACYEGNDDSSNFGNPNCTTGVTRSYQVGLRYSF